VRPHSQSRNAGSSGPRHRGTHRRFHGARKSIRVFSVVAAILGVTVATVGVAALWFTIEYPGRLAAMITSAGASASPDTETRSLSSRYLDLGGLHSSVDPTSSVETARADRSDRADRSATRTKPTAKATSTKPTPSPTKKPSPTPTKKKVVAKKPSGLPSPVTLSDGRPNFQAPFTCGERWRGTTYANHNPEDKKIDFFYQDGETRGRDVRASAPGVVNRILPEIGAIKIYHGNRWYTMYNHMDPILVEVGQKLEQGELVGKAGSVDTGVAHVHYEQIYDADNDDWGSSPAEIVNPIIQEVRYSLSAGDEPIIKSTNNC
jgi:murein DD-endopeptidase MepM/ murein hydrolase activator NlpD